jgi:uncharacterized protein DUF2852
MSFASTAGWQAGPTRSCMRKPHRGLEIAGIILGFIVAWPLAVAYLVWKMMGYPVPTAWKTNFEKNFSFLSGGFASARPGASPTGNRAFDDYRDRELARLEEERRRLDEEAHAFAEFVEELKRAKDREEFDAFMAKRRSATTTA